MAPGTEFARDFYAGIGPLQLGVVLVYHIFILFLVHGQKKSIMAHFVYIISNCAHAQPDIGTKNYNHGTNQELCFNW